MLVTICHYFITFMHLLADNIYSLTIHSRLSPLSSTHLISTTLYPSTTYIIPLPLLLLLLLPFILLFILAILLVCLPILVYLLWGYLMLLAWGYLISINRRWESWPRAHSGWLWCMAHLCTWFRPSIMCMGLEWRVSSRDRLLWVPMYRWWPFSNNQYYIRVSIVDIGAHAAVSNRQMYYLHPTATWVGLMHDNWWGVLLNLCMCRVSSSIATLAECSCAYLRYMSLPALKMVLSMSMSASTGALCLYS